MSNRHPHFTVNPPGRISIPPEQWSARAVRITIPSWRNSGADYIFSVCPIHVYISVWYLQLICLSTETNWPYTFNIYMKCLQNERFDQYIVRLILLLIFLPMSLELTFDIGFRVSCSVASLACCSSLKENKNTYFQIKWNTYVLL